MIQVDSYRASILRDLRDATAGLLFQPEPPPKTAAIVQALEQVFIGTECLISAVSTSNPGWEVRDLPTDEKKMYAEIKHALKILDMVYVEPTRPQQA